MPIASSFLVSDELYVLYHPIIEIDYTTYYIPIGYPYICD